MDLIVCRLMQALLGHDEHVIVSNCRFCILPRFQSHASERDHFCKFSNTPSVLRKFDKVLIVIHFIVEFGTGHCTTFGEETK